MAFLREDEKMKEIKIEKDKKRLQIRRDGHFYKTGNLNRPKVCIPLIEFSYTSQTCGWKLIIHLPNIFAIHTDVQGTYFLIIANILLFISKNVLFRYTHPKTAFLDPVVSESYPVKCI